MFPIPRVQLADVESAFRALMSGLSRLQLVGNFEGEPSNGSVPVYDSTTRKWGPVLKGSIQQLDADPASPEPEQAWILKTGGTYELSYRTLEGTTVRVTLA